MSWTDDRTETLKQLWAEGHSASAITLKLGEVTRNAVIGKVHRLGLPGRRSGPQKTKAPRRSLPCLAARAKAPKTRRSPSPSGVKTFARTPPALKCGPPALGQAPIAPVTVQTLTSRTCRWPEGDPKLPDFQFCGRDKGPAPGPYCSHHAALACR